MNSDGTFDFVGRLEEIRRQKAEREGAILPAPPPAPTPPPVAQPEFNPEVLLPNLLDPRSTEDLEMDRIIDSIDAVTAYNKWIGKMHAVGGKKDGNMISCPNPNHPDKNPSAWINTEDNTWYCAGCEEGGDVYDLAAIGLGYPRPGYKDGATFHKLREDMAASFGYRVKKVPGGQVIYQESPDPVPVPPPTATPPPPPLATTPEPDPIGLKVAPTASSDGGAEGDGTDATVSHLYADDDEPDLVVYPSINWQALIPEDTFLHAYMSACSQDDSPEEYHFWHGLIALGNVVGRNVTLDDNRPVYGNLLLCILGATGTGKSRSRGWLDTVLKAAAPYHEDGTRTTGVKLVPVPGSGEYLVRAFSYEGKDPTNGKSSLGYQTVNGIVDFDEMSALLARANRQGSTLKSTIMGFADARDEVKIGSLTSGDSIAVQPFCSITASTQPKAVRALLSRTDTGSGFLNRWVFAGGKEKETEAIGGSHSSTVIDLTEAIRLLKEVRGWGALKRSITLEPEAYERFVQYFHAKLNPIRQKDDTDLLKRIDLIAKKIMLLLTVNQKRTTVPLSVVEVMIPIVDYVVECFGILNENIGVTLMQDVMNEIQKHIRRHNEKTGRGASPRDIARYTHRKNYGLEQIKKALEVMTALDLIELEPKPAGPGRPTARYRAVGE